MTIFGDPSPIEDRPMTGAMIAIDAFAVENNARLSRVAWIESVSQILFNLCVGFYSVDRERGLMLRYRKLGIKLGIELCDVLKKTCAKALG